MSDWYKIQITCVHILQYSLQSMFSEIELTQKMTVLDSYNVYLLKELYFAVKVKYTFKVTRINRR